MALYNPGGKAIVLPSDGFEIDEKALDTVLDQVGAGKIGHLEPNLAQSILPAVAGNANASYFAASGVPVQDDYGGAFRPGQLLLAVEAVRYEQNPNLAKQEPATNMNRFVFGVSRHNGKTYGVDVTTWKSNEVTKQVADHWDDIDNYVKLHFRSQDDAT